MRCLLFALIFILNISYALPQNGYSVYPTTIELDSVNLLVTYSLSYQEDSLNPNNIRKENMLLFLSDNVSCFLSMRHLRHIEQKKSITSRAELLAVMQDLDFQLPVSRYNYYIFKNYPEGKITKINSIMGDFFKYRQSLNTFDWELTSETSEMNGFKVQKATTEYGGRSWVAWFTPDIPYNDGPYKFNGLPGLILEIRDTRDHYVFELVSVERPGEPMFIEFPERNYIKTTKKDFFRARQSFQNDIISRASEAGLGVEVQQIAAENMRRRNNPLELKVD